MRELFSEMPTHSVKVAGYTIKLELMTQPESESAREWGHYNHQAQTIRMAPNMNPERFFNVMIHEVLHVINDTFGVTDDSVEEQFVTLAANGLTAVWLDNPQLFSWLHKQVLKINEQR